MRLWIIVREDGSIIERGYWHIETAWLDCAKLNQMGRKYRIDYIGDGMYG